MTFSKPIQSYGLVNKEEMIYKGFWRKFDQNKNFPEQAGHKIVSYFDFKTESGEAILIKFALSAVSTKNAVENLNAEIPHWDFEKIKSQAKEKWNNELSKITIRS